MIRCPAHPGDRRHVRTDGRWSAGHNNKLPQGCLEPPTSFRVRAVCHVHRIFIVFKEVFQVTSQRMKWSEERWRPLLQHWHLDNKLIFVESKIMKNEEILLWDNGHFTGHFGSRVKWPSSCFGVMWALWLCAFLLDGHFVPFRCSCSNNDRPRCGDQALQRCPGDLERVHGQVWRPGQRSTHVGCPTTTGHCFSLPSCPTTFNKTPDGNPSFTDRTGLQTGTSHPTSTSWRSMGRVGGHRPVECAGKCCHGKAYIVDYHEYQCRSKGEREEAQDGTDFGSRGRYRVCGRIRKLEECLATEAENFDGRHADGGGGADHRTAERTHEAHHGHGPEPLRRFWHLRSIRSESFAGKQVSIIYPHPRRLCGERTTRPRKLQPMESVFQGIHHSPPHAEHCRLGPAEKLRAVCGEAGPAVSHVLALGLRGGGLGQRLTLNEDENVDVAGGKGGQRTEGLGGRQAMEFSLSSTTSRRRFLEGTSLWAGFDLAGAWRKRKGEDTSRALCYRPPSRWTGSSPTRGREGGRSCRRWRVEEEQQQGKKGSKKEKEACRQRRIRTVSKSRRSRRKEQRGKRKARRRQRTASTLLWMEQWQWAVRIITARTGMRFPSQTDPQVHHLWISGKSVKGLHEERAESSSTEESTGSIVMAAMIGGATSSNRDDTDMDTGGKRQERAEQSGEEGGDRGEKDRGRKRKKDEEEGEGREDRPKTGGALTDYLNKRTFLFVHHYSGAEKDVLSEAIKREAAEQNIKVKTVSVDKEEGSGDLAEDEPYGQHLSWAQRGLIDGYHAGFPCTTFSRLRWRVQDGMPTPVRSKEEPYGLASNDARQQAECDLGTVLAARATNIAKEIEANKPDFTVLGPFSTLENPPESDHPQHLSAWEIEEVKQYLDIPGIRNTNFHTCAYESHLMEGYKRLKPQRMAGSLLGIQTLSKFCGCSLWAGHESILGKKKSKASAVYPPDLCQAYAKLAVTHFKKVGEQEFLAERLEASKREVEQLRNKEKRRRVSQEEEDMGGSLPAPSSSSSTREGWRGGEGKYEMLREPKKLEERPEQLVYIGGMRDPYKVVEGRPTMQAFGDKVNNLWRQFLDEHPKAKEVAETYGTKENEFIPELVIKWKAALKKLVGGFDKPAIKLKGSEEYTSPLDDQLFEAWGRKAGDPEEEVPRWIREGAPLGISKEIKEIGCCGIFPEGEEARNNRSDALGPDELEDAQAQLARGEILNYKTVEDDREEARIELDRYHLAGYTVKYSKQQVKERFPGGTISRLGLIVKMKEGGAKKRRIILDLRRSGGNKKAKLPERLVLPRPKDAISMVRDAYAKTNWQKVEEGEEKAMELAVIDISDAFMALPVHREEHQHTLAPGLEKDEYLAFVALLFGYKVAPLLWSRVASMVARLIQSVVPGYRGQHQCYLDDSLWVLTGTLKQSLRVSLSKGERASSVQWIGVKFTLQQDYLLLTLPEKFMLEVKELLQGWKDKGMAPVKELRSAAGKLSWLAGILPRARWVVAIFYSTLRHHEADLVEGKEEERRLKREDQRKKDHLFHVVRLEQARMWMVAYLAQALTRPVRRLRLKVRNIPNVIQTHRQEGWGACYTSTTPSWQLSRAR